MTLTLWKTNQLPTLTDTITSGGVAVDLTGSTVLFSMRQATSAVTKVNGATATIVSAVAGTISYPWAVGDVDTVGSFLGWWQVAKAGKTQDTPEFSVTIMEHAPASVATPLAVAPDGETTVFQGDAYLAADNRALQYELDLVNIVDLTGLTVTWRVAPARLSKTMTVVGVDAVRVDLTSADTLSLTVGSPQFAIVATTSAGNTVTLLHSTLTVLAPII